MSAVRRGSGRPNKFKVIPSGRVRPPAHAVVKVPLTANGEADVRILIEGRVAKWLQDETALSALELMASQGVRRVPSEDNQDVFEQVTPTEQIAAARELRMMALEFLKLGVSGRGGGGFAPAEEEDPALKALQARYEGPDES